MAYFSPTRQKLDPKLIALREQIRQLKYYQKFTSVDVAYELRIPLEQVNMLWPEI